MPDSSTKPAPALRIPPGLHQVFICLLLAGITLASFWPVGRLGFTIYDDEEYVVKNPHIQAGITADTLSWAFTTTHTGNWHPITWISYMLDCQMFGLKASGHHWMNLGFHIASTLLLFVGLRNMTGTMWRSALVAALFAVHPLRVESVAWISERKDVLSAFFMMLTLLCYAKSVTGNQKLATGSKRQMTGTNSILSRVTRHASPFYLLALFFFALGLMSKPMLVTLPVILLLLDLWPLGRVAGDKWQMTRFRIPVPQFSILKPLLGEKLPFFLLSVASCIATVQAQSSGGSVVSLNGLPLDWRIENSLVSYASYLGKIVWPENLAVFYPIRRIPAWETIGSGLLLAGLTVFCVRRLRRQPYLFVGWFWFLVMLVPVIGLVQVGKQSMADRYSYLPSVGLFIMVAWTMAAIASASKFWRGAMTLGAAGLVLACLPGIRHQLNYWQNDVSLFRHSIEVTPEDNYEGYLFLGNALVESGDLDAAVQSYQSSLQIAPDEMTHLEQAHYNLGCVLFQQSKFQEAEAHFGQALQLDDNDVEAHAGLGRALAAQKKFAEAEAEYSNALRLRPDDAALSKELNVVIIKAESESALAALYEALKVKPTPETHVQIATIQIIQGNYPDAREHYLAALQLQPDAPDILNNLAWLLVACPDTHIRNGAQAVKYAERACELTGYRMARTVGTLAAAYAEAGRFEEAIATAQKACDLAEKSNDPALLQKNQELLMLYRAHQPYHDDSPGSGPTTPTATAPADNGNEKSASHTP